MTSVANPHLLSRLVTGCRRASSVLFGRYLLVTNLSISVSLSATGDILQQHYDILKNNQSEGLDVTRTRNMAASGLTVGILCHYWYIWLDRRLPGRTLRIVFKKLIVDQLVLSPIHISLFFATVGILEGDSVRNVGKEIVEKGYRLYVAEWFVWPVAQVINFAYLPTRYRVLYDNTISLGFDVYTSYVKHGNEKTDVLKEESGTEERESMSAVQEEALSS